MISKIYFRFATTITQFLSSSFTLIESFQCAIPVFAGLLPEPHNSEVLKLLFLLGHWHRLAKLRIHTDETLELLENVTEGLGNHLRKFVTHTCPAFATRELRREAEGRRRRTARENAGVANVSHGVELTNGRRPKVLNLSTYKLHSLGDYAAQIRMFGTTDSYSTQPVGHTALLVLLYSLLLLVRGN